MILEYEPEHGPKTVATPKQFVAIVNTKITKYFWINRQNDEIRLQADEVFRIL